MDGERKRLSVASNGTQITQHGAHIAPGRDGLFNLIKSIPPTLKYRPGAIVAEKDFVIVHGRCSGHGQPANWLVADILGIKGRILIEALGRDPRRSHAGAIKKRPASVRRHVW